MTFSGAQALEGRGGGGVTRGSPQSSLNYLDSSSGRGSWGRGMRNTKAGKFWFFALLALQELTFSSWENNETLITAGVTGL